MSRLGLVATVLAVVAGAALLFVIIEAGQPNFTRLTIENPTDAALRVAVKASPDGALLPLATVQPRSSRTIGSVIDQGERWIFVAGWRDVREEFTVTRDELEQGGWTVQLPARIAVSVHAAYPPLDIDESTGTDH